MRPDSHTTLLAFAIFLAPAATGYAARYIGAGATHASAHTADSLPPLPVFPPEPTHTHPVATDRVVSPFFSEEAPPKPIIEIPNPHPGPAITPPSSDPVFTVTAVMPSPTRPLAVVNGRPRSIGDEVVPGWTVSEIRGDDRAVVLTNAQTSRSVVVRMTAQGQ